MDYRPEVINRLSATFAAGHDTFLKGSPDLFNRYRESAFQDFLRLGIPDRKNEAYRYTNLEKFLNYQYQEYFFPQPADFREAERFHCEVEDLDVWNMVLLNGFFPHGDAARRNMGRQYEGCSEAVPVIARKALPSLCY
jgi:Fe-S cluster assembly protein SufD